MLEGFPLLRHVEASCSVNPVNSSSRRSGGGGGGGKSRRTSYGNGNNRSASTTSTTHTAAGNPNSTTSGAGAGARGDLSRSRSSIVKTTSYMCASTEEEELTFQNAVAGRESMNLGAGRPAPPVYVVADGEERARRNMMCGISSRSLSYAHVR